MGLPAAGHPAREGLRLTPAPAPWSRGRGERRGPCHSRSDSGAWGAAEAVKTNAGAGAGPAEASPGAPEVKAATPEARRRDPEVHGRPGGPLPASSWRAPLAEPASAELTSALRGLRAAQASGRVPPGAARAAGAVIKGGQAGGGRTGRGRTDGPGMDRLGTDRPGVDRHGQAGGGRRGRGRTDRPGVDGQANRPGMDRPGTTGQ